MVVGSIVREIIIRVKMIPQGIKETTKVVNQSVNAMRKQVLAATQIAGLSQRAFRTLNNATSMSTLQFGKYAKSIPMAEWKELGFNLSEGGKKVKDATGKWMGFGKAQKQLSERISTGGAKNVNTFRQLTHGMRGFRMEMLGVMFFGMAMQRMFMGLLQPAMEIAGIFEIISTILQVFFLPVALAMLDPLLAMMDFFLAMPEGVQLAIGVLVIFGAAIGTLLFVVGTLALGLGSIVMAFGPLLSTVTWAISQFGILGGISTILTGTTGGLAIMFSTVLLPAILVIIAIVAALYIAWQQNGVRIQAALDSLFSAFDQIFGGILQVVEGVMDVIFGILELDADKAFGGLKKIAKGAIDFIIGLFINLPISLFLVLAEITRGIIMWGSKLPTFFFELGGNMIKALGSGLARFGKWISNMFWNAIPEPFRSILETMTGLAMSVVMAPMNIGAGIARSLGFGAFAEGGLVTRPTLALLGENGPEVVTPLGQGVGMGNVTFSPVFNISATINNDMDARSLAEKINEVMVQEYRRTISR